jgi:hypothetical protein
MPSTGRSIKRRPSVIFAEKIELTPLKYLRFVPNILQFESSFHFFALLFLLDHQFRLKNVPICVYYIFTSFNIAPGLFNSSGGFLTFRGCESGNARSTNGIVTIRPITNN